MPQTWNVTYDNRDRITGFKRSSGQTQFDYSYDANSNRLSFSGADIIDLDRDGAFETSDRSQNISQSLNIASNSNRLLGFSQTSSNQQGSNTTAITTSSVSFALDVLANVTTDGIRTFGYDEAGRHSETRITEIAGDGEASKVTYLHNGLGQRVFKSEPQVAQTAPNEATLGTDFITWLKNNFSWLFAQAQADATLGQSYVYADGPLPSHAILGEYGNGGANSLGRYEYIWLPTEDGSGAIPIGLYKSAKFFAVHPDHLGTPRQVTDDTNKLVWQWPYSAFGDNSPTGVLAYTGVGSLVFTQDPGTLSWLKLTSPGLVYNLRHPGQYADAETGLFYNYFRTYDPRTGRYTQNDPIGLDGGLNRFGYAYHNGLMFTDSEGLRPYGSPFGRPQYQPSTREIARSGGTLPSNPPSMVTNSNWRDLFNNMGNMPTFPETNLPGSWPGINYIPPITKPLVLPPSGPNNNGCTVFQDSPNQCSAGPKIVCGPTIGPVR